jgi:hypothetical protein
MSQQPDLRTCFRRTLTFRSACDEMRNKKSMVNNEVKRKERISSAPVTYEALDPISLYS